MSAPGSIRDKLQSIAVVATLAALAVALTGNIVGSAWLFHRQQVADMVSQAELVGGLTEPALLFDDPRLAASNLGQFQAHPNVRAAAIYDADGRVFARYGAAGSAAQLPAAPGVDDVRGTSVHVFRPIVSNGTRIGTVYLQRETNLSGTVLGNSMIAMLVAAFALALALVLVRRLGRSVTGPISAMAAAARDVVRQGDYSRRVARTDGDEVGDLVDSFNAMLSEIERRTEELESSYAQVTREADERRLAQQEVMRLNESLERRVQERTAELQDSNRELQLAQAAAVDASRAKSSFLATMSHEIRTPMNGVIGMIDVLHQTSLKGHQVEMVDLIRESAFSLLTIIDDILDFSKIEAGRLELEQAPLSVAGVLEGACAMFDQIAMRRGVELTVAVDPAIPDQLEGDALRLRQVLVNLLSNAVKFSSGRDRPGRVSVRARLLGDDPRRPWVELQVQDNGIGIDDETRARLFTAFSQADASTTRRFGGTGLGLAISRRLVDLMGGELSLDSSPGQGCDFRVRLPFQPPAGDVDAHDRGSGVDGLRCLVVGGPATLAGSIASQLAAGGAQVERASDVYAALSMGAVLQPGPWIFIVDAAADVPPHGTLSRLARSLPGQQIQFVAVGRGSRREPALVEPHVVAVDGNVLSRARLLRAVAIAAGREAGGAHEQGIARERPQAAEPSHVEARRDGRLILVAEDNLTNRKVVVRQLALLGYAADIVENGSVALEAWTKGSYGLLLTDLHMPSMDGYELTAAIRAREKGQRRMPILAFTANALKGEAERCRAAGMDGYLTKPLQLADLRLALETWLPLPSTPGSLAPGDAAAVLDVRVLTSLVGDDPAVVRGFLDEFRAGADRIAAGLRDAVAHRDVALVHAHAHQLKSMARTIGALALGDLCARLEVAGSSGNVDALPPLLACFDRAIDGVVVALDAVVLPGEPIDG